MSAGQNSERNGGKDGLIASMSSLRPAQREVLKTLSTAVKPHLDSILDEFYVLVRADDLLSATLGRGPGVEGLKKAQRDHWSLLLGGADDEELRIRGTRIGVTHVRVGLEPNAYIASYSFLTQRLIELILGPKSKATPAVTALIHAVFIDMATAISAYGDLSESEARRRESEALSSMIELEMQHAKSAMQEQGESLGAVVADMRRAIESVIAGGELVGRGSSASFSGIQSVASATEEMTASSREVGLRALDTERLVKEAIDQSEAASQIMNRLSEASTRITEAARLIDAIARQTNLLALNATIEAARAGDAGRGFAVVAQEVKQLSQRTAAATQEIAGQIQSVTTASVDAVNAMAAVNRSVNGIGSVASGVAQNAEAQARAIRDVTSSAHAAAAGAEDLRNSVQLINQGAAEAGKVTEIVAGATREVLNLFNELEKRLVVTVKGFSATDSRKHPRLPTRWDVLVTTAAGSFKALTIEASLGGLLLETSPASLKEGAAAEVEIAGVGKLRAKVAGHQPMGTRLEFMVIAEPVRSALAARLAEVEAAEVKVKTHLRKHAVDIERLFTEAVKSGQVTIEDLFDTKYVNIPGTNPQQVTTRALAFLDQNLPGIQEPILAFDPKIVFCAVVDRNGYLPVHNRRFSQPQGSDPVWNAANARNRRVFDDRTGLAAARNIKEFLVQTYLRDMGGGSQVLMKDISTPIVVDGKHWGALRMGIAV